MQEAQFLTGIGFALAGGLLQGAMLWPMKWLGRWEWENSWLGFCLASYLLAPWVLAFWTVPHLVEVLSGVASRTLAMTFLFGLGWGLGTVFFGLGIAALGLGLGYAIIMGLTVSVGTLVPLVVLSPETLFSARGVVLIIGVAAIVVGTSLCSYAGKLRESKLGVAVAPQAGTLRRSYLVGLLLCVSAGILIPGGNLALAFGREIPRQAQALGASELGSVNALWAVAMTPLFLLSAVYCWYRFQKNQSFRRFRLPGTEHYWLWILVMGVAQMAGIAFYGFGAASLGPLGTSIGFSILMSTMVLTANLLGVLSGEWKGAGGRPAQLMGLGLLILTGAICLIGYGNRPGV